MPTPIAPSRSRTVMAGILRLDRLPGPPPSQRRGGPGTGPDGPSPTVRRLHRFAVDEADRRPGQVVDDLHDSRLLVRGDALTTEGDQLLAGGRLPGDGLDHGFHRLSPHRIGHADDAGVAHLGMSPQRVLDLGRVDVLRRRLDQLRPGPDEGDRAVGLAATQVVAQPPAPQPGAFRFTTRVAEHHQRSTHRDLAGLTRRYVRTVGPDDAYLGDGRGDPVRP